MLVAEQLAEGERFELGVRNVVRFAERRAETEPHEAVQKAETMVDRGIAQSALLTKIGLRRLKRGIERPCGSTSKVHGVAALISIHRLSRGPVRFGEFGLAYELCSNPVLLPLSPPHSIERITEHVQYIFIETLSIGVAVEGAIRHGSMHEKAHQRRGHPQSSGAIIRD